MSGVTRLFLALALLAARVPLAEASGGDQAVHAGEPVYESSVGGVIRAPAIAGAPGQGYLVFNKWCSGCHAPDYAPPGDPAAAGKLPQPARMALGTALLRQRYQGTLPAELERRTDLAAPAIIHFVRHGLNAMPPFRKTEISDSELSALVAYLTHATAPQ